MKPGPGTRRGKRAADRRAFAIVGLGASAGGLEAVTELRRRALAAEDATAGTRAADTFVGTGTRNLSDDGRQALRDLFIRSFGPATQE